MAASRNIALLIANKLDARGEKNFSGVITNIAVGSIAVGIVVMILAYSVYFGYRDAVKDKIVSIASDIVVKKYDQSTSYESTPVSTNSKLYKRLKNIEGVRAVQSIARKPALLKTNNEVKGAVLKGWGQDFDSTTFDMNLTQGRFVNLTTSEQLYKKTAVKEIMLSEKTMRTLELKLGDTIKMFFIQPIVYRRVVIVGVFETGMEDFDDVVAFTDIRLIQNANEWSRDLVSEFEVYVKDFERLTETAQQVETNLSFDVQMTLVTQQYQHFFDWFTMLSQNVQLVIIIILIVAGLNIVSVLLIMIMERTQMIGTLKALGAPNKLIRNVFFYRGIRMIVKGLFIGNLLGVVLGNLQKYLKIVPLDPSNYYVDAVPISFDWMTILFLNLLMLAVVAVILLLPTAIISKVRPIKAIKFD